MQAKEDPSLFFLNHSRKVFLDEIQYALIIPAHENANRSDARGSIEG
jgi:hypothetical protein